LNFFQDIDSIKLTRRPFFTMPAKWYPSFITGRGLPFRNAYNSGFNTPVRLHSPEKMIFDLIDILTFYPGANSIPVEDYLLLHDSKRFKTFCNMFKEASIEKYFKLEIKAKIYQLNEENISLIKNVLKSKEIEIDFGSLLQQSSKNIRNPYLDLTKQLDILELCKKHDLFVTGKFLVNLPQESKADISKSYWIIKNNHLKILPNLKIKIEIGNLQLGSEFWLRSNIKKTFDDISKPSDLLGIYRNLKSSFVFNNLNNTDDIKIAFSDIKNKEFRTELTDNSFKKQQANWMRYITYQKILEILYSKDLLPDAIDDILHRMNFSKPVEKPEDSSNDYSQIIQSLVSNINWSSLIDTPYLDRLIQEIKTNPTYEFKYFKEEEPLFPSMITLMSETISKEVKIDIQKIFNLIRETNKTFNIANYKNKIWEILRTGKLLTMVSPDIIEQIIFDKSIKSILQITELDVMDLNQILEDRAVDTMERHLFNDSKYKPVFNKKYDCIVLFFSFDMVSKHNKLIQFCSRILNEHGTLIITSINPKNIVFVSELLCNGDFSGLINNRNYMNPNNINNFVDFIKNYNFIPKKIVPYNFPDKEYFNETQKNVYEKLRKYDLRDEEVLVFAYTSVFRKKVRRLVL
ncbi:MAG: hypothetical protein ACK4IX_02280, partial [Candidatus Sericytochromatia bacterium]